MQIVLYTEKNKAWKSKQRALSSKCNFHKIIAIFYITTPKPNSNNNNNNNSYNDNHLNLCTIIDVSNVRPKGYLQLPAYYILRLQTANALKRTKKKRRWSKRISLYNTKKDWTKTTSHIPRLSLDYKQGSLLYKFI